jgi:hypothetical protein
MNYALKMRALGLGEIHPQSQSNQESVEIPLNKDTTKTTEFTDGNFETAKEKKIKKQKRRHSEELNTSQPHFEDSGAHKNSKSKRRRLYRMDVQKEEVAESEVCCFLFGFWYLNWRLISLYTAKN